MVSKTIYKHYDVSIVWVYPKVSIICDILKTGTIQFDGLWYLLHVIEVNLA